jgi:hypothetical protein
MGYGEVGGDGSVYVSVHLKNPVNPQTEERPEPAGGPNGGVHGRADALVPPQRSADAKARVPAGTGGRGYRGKDQQDLAIDDARNVFEVKIHFSRDADVAAAIAALQALPSPLPGGGAMATFPLKVINRAGQVHVWWPD